MTRTFKMLGQSLFATLLLVAGFSTAQAATQQYYATIVGDVTVGEETFGPGSNVWGLSAGDVVEANISFTADLGGTETGTDINIDTIFIRLPGDVAWPNYQSLNQSDMDGAITISLDNGALTDFSFFTTDFDFNSSFTFFDDGVGGSMFGDWQTDVTLSNVPVPAAVWLFGSALGLLGWVRRKPTV